MLLSAYDLPASLEKMELLTPDFGHITDIEDAAIIESLHKRGMMLMATMMCTTVKRTDIVCIGRTPLTKNQSHTQTTKETQSYKIPHTIPPFMIKRMNFGQRGSV